MHWIKKDNFWEDQDFPAIYTSQREFSSVFLLFVSDGEVVKTHVLYRSERRTVTSSRTQKVLRIGTSSTLGRHQPAADLTSNKRPLSASILSEPQPIRNNNRLAHNLLNTFRQKKHKKKHSWSISGRCVWLIRFRWGFGSSSPKLRRLLDAPALWIPMWA